MPPPIAARMAVTIDSISHGRFGVNIISGWQRREYTQMGIWPGAEHYKRRYDYCAEYVTIMRELWETGRSDFKGDFFQMDDCRCLPLPTANIPIICAAQSDAGTTLRRAIRRLQLLLQRRHQRPDRHGNAQRRPPGEGDPGNRPRLRRPDPDHGHRRRNRRSRHGQVGTLQGRHRLEALAYRDAQAEDDPSRDPLAGPNKRRTLGTHNLPTQGGVLVGSYATIARMLDEMAEVPGVRRCHADVRRFRHRHGAVRHPHPAADALPERDQDGRMSVMA